MQPYHWCCHDMKGDDAWARNLGRSRWSDGFRWRSIADAGATMIHGSDWPVVTIDPLIGIYSAIAREDPQGRPAGGWFPDQRLSLPAVLAGYTRSAAYSSFREHALGTLEPGKLADLVALDRDLRSIAPRDVLTTQIAATVLDGKVIYEGRHAPDRTAEIPRRTVEACACRKFTRPVM